MRLALLAFLLLATAARAEPAALDKTLATAMEARAVPALGVLTMRDFKVEAVAVRGVRRLGATAPVTADDRWHLGSDGKAMTATMIARLVDRGVLSWTTPLSQMLPDLAAGMQPDYRDVTLLDLLSHRAGLGEMDDKDPAFQAAYADARPTPQQHGDWVKRFLGAPSAGPKRAAMKYSNQGFITAAYIAERATGKPYAQLMREEVFAPLGMKSPRLGPPGGGELSGHVGGKPETAQDANPAFVDPAGGWRMTLSDWAVFCLDQMEGERGRGRLLKPASYKMLHTPQGDTVAALGWGAPAKAAGRQGPALTHSGSDGAWYALVLLFPGRGNGVLVTANAADDMGGDKAATAVIHVVAEGLAPAAAP